MTYMMVFYHMIYGMVCYNHMIYKMACCCHITINNTICNGMLLSYDEWNNYDTDWHTETLSLSCEAQWDTLNTRPTYLARTVARTKQLSSLLQELLNCELPAIKLQPSFCVWNWTRTALQCLSQLAPLYLPACTYLHAHLYKELAVGEINRLARPPQPKTRPFPYSNRRNVLLSCQCVTVLTAITFLANLHFKLAHTWLI